MKELIPNQATLLLILLINILNINDRNLIYSFVSYMPSSCSSDCDDYSKDERLVCENDACFDEDAYTNTTALCSCVQCLEDHDIESKNLLQGTCTTTSEYGYLVGMFFLLFFAVGGLLAAYLCELYNQRTLHSAAIILWSCCLFLLAGSSSFPAVVAVRVLLSFFQAFNAPCCYSIIANQFPSDKKSTVNGVYSIGTYMGGGLASLAIVFNSTIGWRSVSTIFGVAGVLCGVLRYVYIRDSSDRRAFGDEPFDIPTHPPLPPSSGPSGRVRVTEEQRSELAFWEAKRLREEVHHRLYHPARLADIENPEKSFFFLLFSPSSDYPFRKIVLFTYLASSFRMMGVYLLYAYLPIYVASSDFSQHMNAFSIVSAASYALFGSLSCLGGGILANKLMAHFSDPTYLVRVPFWGILLSALSMGAMFFSSSFYAFIFYLNLTYLLGEAWMAPTMAFLMLFIPKDCRRDHAPTSTALLLFFNSVISILGPLFLSRKNASSTYHELVFTLLTMASYLGSAFFYAQLVAMCPKYHPVHSELSPKAHEGSELQESPLYQTGQKQQPMPTPPSSSSSSSSSSSYGGIAENIENPLASSSNTFHMADFGLEKDEEAWLLEVSDEED